jgi:hypothetical protein
MPSRSIAANCWLKKANSSWLMAGSSRSCDSTHGKSDRATSQSSRWEVAGFSFAMRRTSEHETRKSKSEIRRKLEDRSSNFGFGNVEVTQLGLAQIFHKGLERNGGERVRRLVITEPDENTLHRHSANRL